jgi:hypothetical protein
LLPRGQFHKTYLSPSLFCFIKECQAERSFPFSCFGLENAERNLPVQSTASRIERGTPHCLWTPHEITWTLWSVSRGQQGGKGCCLVKEVQGAGDLPAPRGKQNPCVESSWPHPRSINAVAWPWLWKGNKNNIPSRITLPPQARQLGYPLPWQAGTVDKVLHLSFL